MADHIITPSQHISHELHSLQRLDSIVRYFDIRDEDGNVFAPPADMGTINEAALFSYIVANPQVINNPVKTIKYFHVSLIHGAKDVEKTPNVFANLNDVFDAMHRTRRLRRQLQNLATTRTTARNPGSDSENNYWLGYILALSTDAFITSVIIHEIQLRFAGDPRLNAAPFRDLNNRVLDKLNTMRQQITQEAMPRGCNSASYLKTLHATVAAGLEMTLVKLIALPGTAACRAGLQHLQATIVARLNFLAQQQHARVAVRQEPTERHNHTPAEKVYSNVRTGLLLGAHAAPGHGPAPGPGGGPGHGPGGGPGHGPGGGPDHGPGPSSRADAPVPPPPPPAPGSIPSVSSSSLRPRPKTSLPPRDFSCPPPPGSTKEQMDAWAARNASSAVSSLTFGFRTGVPQASSSLPPKAPAKKRSQSKITASAKKEPESKKLKSDAAASAAVPSIHEKRIGDMSDLEYCSKVDLNLLEKVHKSMRKAAKKEKKKEKKLQRSPT